MESAEIKRNSRYWKAALALILALLAFAIWRISRPKPMPEIAPGSAARSEDSPADKMPEHK